MKESLEGGPIEYCSIIYTEAEIMSHSGQK